MDNWKKYKDKATTITIGNHKGGVGKTTNTILIAYTLARMGHKTLVVDMDGQCNATKSLMLTKYTNSKDNSITTVKHSLMIGIMENDLTTLPVNIIDNLDLMPSYIDLEELPKYLYQNFKNEQDSDYLMKNLLEPVKKEYDMILIDVPPMNLAITNNAVISSDYVLISLQTHERSLTGAENYIANLIKLRKKYDLDLDVIGILPVLHRRQGKVDEYIIETAKKKYGNEAIFNTVIPQMERIKRFDINGITNEDLHDKRVLEIYKDVTKELIERLRSRKG